MKRPRTLALIAFSGLLLCAGGLRFSSLDDRLFAVADAAQNAPGALVPVDQLYNCSGVQLFDTHGLVDEASWTEISDPMYEPADVRHLVLDNGVARATYEYLSAAEQGSHSLYVRRDGELERITSAHYGDYTYWITTITEPAVSVSVTKMDGNTIELSYLFEHSPGVSWAPTIDITKRVAMMPCQPGMFYKFETSLPNATGERELGVGRGTPLAFSESALAVHPLEAKHVNLGLYSETSRLPWAGTIGDDDWLRVLALRKPMVTLSYQFDPRQLGYVTVNQFLESEDDGDYQAFLGAVPYESDAVTAQAELFSGYVMNDALAQGGRYLWIPFGNSATLSFDVPEDGEYLAWIRVRGAVATDFEVSVDGDSMRYLTDPSPTFHYEPIARLFISQGVHSLQLRSKGANVDLDSVVFVPVGKARNVASTAAESFGSSL